MDSLFLFDGTKISDSDNSNGGKGAQGGGSIETAPNCGDSDISEKIKSFEKRSEEIRYDPM